MCIIIHLPTLNLLVTSSVITLWLHPYRHSIMFPRTTMKITMVDMTGYTQDRGQTMRNSISLAGKRNILQ